MGKSKKRKEARKINSNSAKPNPPQSSNPETNSGIAIVDSVIKEQLIDICLVMIVKDEEDSIEKCIRNVAPYISYWVIVDTGSQDKTKEVIRETMDNLGIPGELHERPWVNFEVNRTESLELAKGKCDYRWIIDADDTFNALDPKINPFWGLNDVPDCYQITYRLSSLQYHRVQLVKSSQDWVYKGVLHEYLYLDKEGMVQGIVPNCYVAADISPLKRANSLEEKYANDAKILEEALIKEPSNTRYVFYLAQSYRDSAQLHKALEAYERRIKMGEWEEEVYYSMYMCAKIKERLGFSVEEVTELYSKAWEYRPSRLECVFHTMRKLREQKRFLLAFAYGDLAIKTRGTSDILFVEPEIWQWRLLDEYSLAAYYTGNPEISLEKTTAIVNAPFFKEIHDEEKKRLMKNIEFYKKGFEDKKRKIKEMELAAANQQK
jgi:glycosyltransferase involved in cell wall biosynthesis